MNTQTENWLNSVTIRPWRESDLPALEWDGEYSDYRLVYRGVFRNSLRGLACPLLAETAADGMIGQVILSERSPSRAYDPYHPVYFLTSFRIKPAFRSHGLGARMLAACANMTLRRGFSEIFLNVAVNNPRAVAFYRRNGFGIVREEEARWSYIDPRGRQHDEHELSYLMRLVVTG